MGEPALTSYTCKLDDAQAAQLEAYLLERDYEVRAVPHTRFAGHRNKLNINFYVI